MAYATATVLAYLAIGSAVASTATAVYGQQQAKKSAEEAAIYNNKLAADAARNKELETAEALRRQRERDKSDRSRLRAQLAQRGSVVASGTPLDLIGKNAANQELAIADALRASQIEASNIRSGGAMGLWEARQAGNAANLESAGTTLSGLSSATSSAYDSYKSGAFKTTRTKSSYP